jgi:hypothetical protein
MCAREDITLNLIRPGKNHNSEVSMMRCEVHLKPQEIESVAEPRELTLPFGTVRVHYE